MAAPILVKLGLTVATKPKESMKIVKGVAIFLVAFLMVIGAVCNNFFAFFIGENMTAVKQDITKTNSYSQIMEIYVDYMEDVVKPELQERRDKLYYFYNWEWLLQIEQGTYEGGAEEVNVNILCNGVNPAYMMAYLTHISDEFKMGNTKIDKQEIIDFLDGVMEYTSRRISDTEYIICNAVATPEEAGDLFFTDPEKLQMFLISFDLYTEFVGIDNISSEGLNGAYGENIQLPDSGLGMKIPLYHQNDYKTKYGSGTIASSGCAPTSIAMVLSYLKGMQITPPNIVEFTGNKYYVPGAGSSWGIFNACAANWNATCTNLGKDKQKVLSELRAGHPVIASMGPGTFTKSGHLIVLRGINGNKFLVNDPNKSNYLKYRTDEFDMNTVFGEAKNFWSMY